MARRAWTLLVACAVCLSLGATLAGPSAADAPTNPPLLPPRPWRARLPVLLKGWNPRLVLTHVPQYGSWGDPLLGRAEGVAPSDYRVAVYIYVNGWWNKPTWAEPLTPLDPDGSWRCNITTGGADEQATQIAAFLLPHGYAPPLLSGAQELPDALNIAAVARAEAQRAPTLRRIAFSGYNWRVKTSRNTVGPGPNYFSDDEEDVFVDREGRLHLRIAQREGRWYCTEVINEAPLQYGKYIFRLSSRVDQLDPNVVLGLFTWDDLAPERNYREIDIEFSLWGVPSGVNAQYVIQPWDVGGNRYRWSMRLEGVDSTHGFHWSPGRAYFQSLRGHHQDIPGPFEEQMESCVIEGPHIPPAENTGGARMNLWLMNGQPPTDGQPLEVIVEGFTFIPDSSQAPHRPE